MRSTPKEPLIHWAIIHDQQDVLKNLAESPRQREMKNSIGLSPIELASFLGRKGCLKMLSTAPPKSFLVKPKGEETIRTISEAEYKSLFVVDYASSLRFKNLSFLRKTAKNLPYLFRTSLFNQEAVSLGSKYEMELIEGKVAPVSIQWIDEEWGYGLFAEKEISKGEWVGEYTGVVRRLFRLHQDHNAYCLHYPTKFWSWEYTIIDSLFAGNEIRFINHSNAPNLSPKYLLKGNFLHFVLFSNQKIKRDDQLFFDYGKDFWINKTFSEK